MSPERRRALIKADRGQLSIARQCELVSISRSSFYYRPLSRHPDRKLRQHLVRLTDDEGDFIAMPIAPIATAVNDGAIDAVLIVGTIARERRPKPCHLSEQGVDLEGVIDIVRRQGRGDDLPRVDVHAEMQLSAGPAGLGAAMFLDQPLTGAAELQPGAGSQIKTGVAVLSQPTSRGQPVMPATTPLRSASFNSE
jgi:hypothetical protein